MIAWTTTHWTLPSNLALCVHPDFTYVKVKDWTTEKVYIMLEDRLEALFKTPEEYEVIEWMVGKSLVGRKYQPLFPYFAHLKSDEPDKGAFRVLRKRVCPSVVRSTLSLATSWTNGSSPSLNLWSRL